MELSALAAVQAWGGETQEQRLLRHLGAMTDPEECRGFLDALHARSETVPPGVLFKVQQKLTELE